MPYGWDQGFSEDHSVQTPLCYVPRPDRFLIQTATWKQNSAQMQLSFHSVVLFSCISMSLSSFFWCQLLSSLTYDPYQRTAVMAQMIFKTHPQLWMHSCLFWVLPVHHFPFLFLKTKTRTKTFISKHLLPLILKS